MADLLFSNYGELQVSLADYMYGRKDLTSRIPGFINLAERRMYRRLRVRENQLSESGTITTNQIALPEGYLETKTLVVDDAPLERITDLELEGLQRVAPDAGAPRAFARVDGNLEVFPTPSEEMTFTHQYWRSYSGSLVNSTDTNPILEEYPDLYLYGSLMEYMPFAAKDARIQVAKALFEEAMTAAMQEYGEQETSGSPMDVTSVYGDRNRAY